MKFVTRNDEKWWITIGYTYFCEFELSVTSTLSLCVILSIHVTTLLLAYIPQKRHSNYGKLNILKLLGGGVCVCLVWSDFRITPTIFRRKREFLFCGRWKKIICLNIEVLTQTTIFITRRRVNPCFKLY